MRFLVDRCAGRRLSEWLRQAGHEVVESRSLGPDPGDRTLLEIAAREGRVLVTIDTDFGKLIFLEGVKCGGVIRLPDVPSHARLRLLQQVLQKHESELAAGAIVTVRGGRIRISYPPA